MGNKILIYDTGQVYEIDVEKIYVPVFAKPKEDKTDTESKETNPTLI